jgi:hypothetical protein
MNFLDLIVVNSKKYRFWSWRLHRDKLDEPFENFTKTGTIDENPTKHSDILASNS